MMSPGKDYAPCPHCAANNITHRQICWRCGHTLPYTIGLDGQPRSNNAADPRSVSKSEIEKLLAQAQTCDIQADKRREAETAEQERRAEQAKDGGWLWLRKRIARRSGA